MKKLLTLMIFLCIGTFMSFTVSAQSNWGLKKNVFDSPYFDKIVKYLNPEDLRAAGLPQKTHGYYWDADWVYQSYLEISYYPNGNIHVETNFDINTNLPTDRSTYTYDGQGRLTEIFGESNETGSWENAIKYTLAYDSHGNLNEVVASMWTGEDWWIIFGGQQVYTYTPQDYVSAITFKTYDFFSGWLWDEKDIYTLDGSGYPTQILFQSYNGAWADSARYINIDWHEYVPQAGFGSFDYFVEELWNGTNWVTNLRESTVYDASEGYVMTRQVYSGGWVNSYRETVLIENNRLTLMKFEDWIDFTWVQSSGEKFFYTFSGDNLIEEIIQDYDPGIPGYVNWSKSVYSDFFYTTGVMERIQESTFQIYPNPVGDDMTIQLNNDLASVWHFEILNLTGQILFSERIDLSASKMITLPVNELPEGMYIFRATANDQVFTGKFLKE